MSIAGALLKVGLIRYRTVAVVGSHEYCDVRIREPRVEEIHCLLLVDRYGIVYVEDLASHCGTRIAYPDRPEVLLGYYWDLGKYRLTSGLQADGRRDGGPLGAGRRDSRSQGRGAVVTMLAAPPVGWAVSDWRGGETVDELGVLDTEAVALLLGVKPSHGHQLPRRVEVWRYANQP